MPTQDQLNRLTYVMSIRAVFAGDDAKFLADLEGRLMTGAGFNPERYSQDDAARVELIYATTV